MRCVISLVAAGSAFAGPVVELVALNRGTGAIDYRRQLPTSTNSPIAIAGNTIIVPAGGPKSSTRSGDPQVVAYTAR